MKFCLFFDVPPVHFAHSRTQSTLGERIKEKIVKSCDNQTVRNKMGKIAYGGMMEKVNFFSQIIFSL